VSGFDPEETWIVAAQIDQILFRSSQFPDFIGGPSVDAVITPGQAMRRRDFIKVVAGAWPLAARAQQAPKMLRIGTVSAQPKSDPIWMAFERRMAELGYAQGENFILEMVPAASREGYEQGYRKLVARNIDIVVASGPEIALKSAVAATPALPIVMVAIDFDPLARGYVKSLARPGGNVTGVFFQQIELAVKRAQLLKDAFPHSETATVFWDAISADQWRATQSAAEALGLRVVGIELHETPYDYERAFAQSPLEHRGELLVMVSPFFYRDRAQLADLVLRHRIVSMFGSREWVDAGGLLSYGASLPGLYRRAAEFVDRLARGSKASDLPIEQPTKFELIVNLRTAKAIGVMIPQSLLLRADEVIE
jgi:putative ABC transport system substrate-binding protein